jgi:hypothetical protein
VVLGADLDAARGHVSDRVVASVVPEGQLEGRATKSLAEDLVAHADSEDGLLAQEGLGILNGVGGSGRVTLQKHKQKIPSEKTRSPKAFQADPAIFWRGERQAEQKPSIPADHFSLPYIWSRYHYDEAASASETICQWRKKAYRTGPLLKKTPSGFMARTSAAGV